MPKRTKQLWGDIRTAPRAFMQEAFTQERQRIARMLLQLKTDVDSYNENYNTGAPIVLVLDFTDDMAEMEIMRLTKEEAGA